MKPALVEDIIRFIRAHGTAKLKAASDATLRDWIPKMAAHDYLFRVADEGKTVALGIGWPCRRAEPLQPIPEGRYATVVYVANLCASDADALRWLLVEAGRRWPCAGRYIAQRTPKRQREDAAAEGKWMHYNPRAMDRLHRFACVNA
jgi:hypothetical protein